MPFGVLQSEKQITAVDRQRTKFMAVNFIGGSYEITRIESIE